MSCIMYLARLLNLLMHRIILRLLKHANHFTKGVCVQPVCISSMIQAGKACIIMFKNLL